MPPSVTWKLRGVKLDAILRAPASCFTVHMRAVKSVIKGVIKGVTQNAVTCEDRQGGHVFGISSRARVRAHTRGEWVTPLTILTIFAGQRMFSRVSR